MPTNLTIYAREASATDSHLQIGTHRGKHEIRWELCSERLSQATQAERSLLILSPSGCSIRWPLIDEDLAIGPLILPKS
ncbi:MAG: DUF2442 domain-containing protein [Acidobacteria bacterium]|nr:DUF2442 domain-containing protein [Acidobacteriota bacterium]